MVVTQSGLSSTLNGLSVGAWKASRFTSQNKFPDLGRPIPASPDATTSVAAGAFSLSTPTNEDYWVAVYDGSNNVKFHWLTRYSPPAYTSPVLLCGSGNPTTLGVPAPPNGVYFDVSNSDPGANLRMFVARNGSWVAAAA